MTHILNNVVYLKFCVESALRKDKIHTLRCYAAVQEGLCLNWMCKNDPVKENIMQLWLNYTTSVIFTRPISAYLQVPNVFAAVWFYFFMFPYSSHYWSGTSQSCYRNMHSHCKHVQHKLTVFCLLGNIACLWGLKL